MKIKVYDPGEIVSWESHRFYLEIPEEISHLKSSVTEIEKF